MNTAMKITLVIAVAAVAAAGAGRHKIAGAVHKAETAASAKLATPPPKLPADAPIPPTVIGMNVTGLNYFTPEDAFIDPIKNHAEISLQGPKFTPNWVMVTNQVPRDAHGGLLHVPKDTKLLIQGGIVRQIDGRLICRVSPGWQVSALTAMPAQDGTKVTITRDKNAKLTDTWSFVFVSQRDDVALTDFSCRSESAPAQAKFRPAFLTDMKPFGIIRFMNWMHANDQPDTTWAKRPDPADMTFTVKGAPVEYMVELANEVHADPWFTLPLGADDDYQRRFATYVRDHLAPGLKVYAELSNEVWNSSFPQAKEATKLGKASYPSEDEAHANDYYYGDRVRHMMGIWSDVFAGQKQRLVRVASTQAAWPERGEFLLGHGDTAKSVDVLAIAPYFGDIPFDVPGTGAARVDGILARLPASIETRIAKAKQSKAIAMKYGVRLVTYEAGSALDAFTPEMLKDVQATLHDPRLVPIYQSYITRWAKEIGGEMVLFDTNGGVWGHSEYTGQPWQVMPKMHAAINVIAGLPQGKERGVKPIAP